MKQSSNVPAFLSKLWTLVEETHTNEFITWSQNGQSFLVLDEQRFAKEILPKYFKHNNMASFVRQLNMYGFRKVVHIDSGIVKQERDGPVEFQHPYFKQGQDDLLENIKRKVSSSKPEENKIRQEDLTKIISSAQKVQIKQETIESRLSELKSENESLWKEVSELRAKHAQQQQVIRKVSFFPHDHNCAYLSTICDPKSLLHRLIGFSFLYFGCTDRSKTMKSNKLGQVYVLFNKNLFIN
ncbi:heat shock transcription factor 2 [Phyllostomus discolor]|uniref:Heat shock transcription factor 2 n=1 Tax=Phyllostomus discolor TaxID=89673 RepID=A0A834EAW9_9CHIR|nr:heat shock transcription factor 2 [Phyllostomus discolor]